MEFKNLINTEKVGLKWLEYQDYLLSRKMNISRDITNSSGWFCLGGEVEKDRAIALKF